MNFKTSMEIMHSGQSFSQIESYQLMQQIGNGEFSEIETTALIVAIGIKGIVLDELKGFRNALLDLSIQIDLRSYDLIDLCGTGGDGKNTFNISTLASFVVAAAGYKVAKHGNYGVSSISGSSTILEKLGYKFSADESKLEHELNHYGICFLHAPLFHPALKNVADIRKKLGIRTLFNTLGPLVNPAKTKKQLVGVYNLELARMYHYLLQEDQKDYTVVHSIDGYDEISLTADLQLFSSRGEAYLTPAQLGQPKIEPNELFSGYTVNESLKIFNTVIENRGSVAQTNAVLMNAAAAIQCFENSKSLETCYAIAREALVSGKASSVLKKLLNNQSYVSRNN